RTDDEFFRFGGCQHRHFPPPLKGRESFLPPMRATHTGSHRHGDVHKQVEYPANSPASRLNAVFDLNATSASRPDRNTRAIEFSLRMAPVTALLAKVEAALMSHPSPP